MFWILSWLFTIWFLGYIVTLAFNLCHYNFIAPATKKKLNRPWFFFKPALWPIFIIFVVLAGDIPTGDLDDF